MSDRAKSTPIALVIEDEPSSQKTRVDFLRSHGFSVLGVTSAASALREFNESSVDIVISDISLNPNQPRDKSGIKLAKMIKKLDPNVPIIGYSTFLEQNLTAEERSAFDGFVTKGLATPREFQRYVIDWKHMAARYRAARLVGQERAMLPGEADRKQSIVVFHGTIVEAFRAELRKDPSALTKISPRNFELLIAELLESMGYEVELTLQTRDGGRDILARAKIPPSKPILYIVECKKWRDDIKIGVGDVRKFMYVVRDQDRASGGMFVTTAYFTSGARVLEQQWKYLLSLHDRDAVAGWLAPRGTWHRSGDSRIWVPRTN